MPVHKVPGGWQWGSSGKVYKSKAKAESQARAIYASGYRGDAVRDRKRIARLLRASAKAETRYVRDLLRVSKSVHEGLLSVVDREVLPAREHHLRHDAQPFDQSILPKLFRYVRRMVGPAFDRMSKVVSESNEEALELLGIRPSMVPGLEGRLSQAREENIRLMVDAGRDYADDVAEVLRDPDNLGLRVEELRDLLQERAEVSESRATLIARDQTLKTNAMVTRGRMEAAGVARYTWSTSRDERVRPMHAELEGETFSWDDPPVTNDAGDTNHPGEDIQCRCIPIPHLADEEAEPSGEELAAE